jgi:hypothetical protein
MMRLRLRFSVALFSAFLPAALTAQRPGEQIAPTTQYSDSAALISDDLRNFSRVLALLQERKERDTVAVLSREYFERATPGLRAYIARYSLTTSDLASAMGRYPRYYASLGTLANDVSRTHEHIRAAYAQLQRHHPGAVYPPAYFFIGNLGPGGLTRPEGLLVSAELFGATPTRDVGEFTAELPRVQSLERLPYLVTHELMHYQQAVTQGIEAYRAVFGERQTLLALAIREGSADFLAHLISGGTVYDEVHAFGRTHERELWQQFREAMHRRDPGDWMFNRPAQPGRPMDLGYFIGYRITESFFMNAPDKRGAIQDILAVTDYDTFLRRSRYPDAFR